jgi:hypothetical protein
MPNPWMPGIRHDPGASAGYEYGVNRMWMPIGHSTGGTNSYDICKNGRGGEGASLCQILFPKVGPPTQFCEINAVCWHAGSRTYGDYNDDGPGYEVERRWIEAEQRWEELTDDQSHYTGEFVRWLASEWGVPDSHYWGPRLPYHQANFHGHVNHADVHPNLDGFTQDEWDRLTIGAPAPEEEETEMVIFKSTDNGKVTYFETVGNGFLAVIPDALAAGYVIQGKVNVVDLGGPFGVIGFNAQRKAEVQKLLAAGYPV